jgi:hypothetical protein
MRVCGARLHWVHDRSTRWMRLTRLARCPLTTRTVGGDEKSRKSSPPITGRLQVIHHQQTRGGNLVTMPINQVLLSLFFISLTSSPQIRSSIHLLLSLLTQTHKRLHRPSQKGRKTIRRFPPLPSQLTADPSRLLQEQSPRMAIRC